MGSMKKTCTQNAHRGFNSKTILRGTEKLVVVNPKLRWRTVTKLPLDSSRAPRYPAQLQEELDIDETCAKG